MADNKTIMIYDTEFSVPQPYGEGHTLSAVEAKVLNQCFAENIANNQRKNIKAAMDGGEGAPTMAEAVTAFNAYANEYQFTEAAAGGSRTTMTPVEREAKRIAKELVKEKLASKGKKLKDLSSEDLEAAAARFAEHEQVQKLAKKRVAEQEKLSEISLDGNAGE